jgi:hypothetical protein
MSRGLFPGCAWKWGTRPPTQSASQPASHSLTPPPPSLPAHPPTHPPALQQHTNRLHVTAQAELSARLGVAVAPEGGQRQRQGRDRGGGRGGGGRDLWSSCMGFRKVQSMQASKLPRDHLVHTITF